MTSAKMHQIVVGIGTGGGAVTVSTTGAAAANRLVWPGASKYPAARFVVTTLTCYDTANGTVSCALSFAGTVFHIFRWVANQSMIFSPYMGWPFLVSAGDISWDGSGATTTSVVQGYWE